MRFTKTIFFIVLLTFVTYVSAEPNSQDQPVGQVMFFTGKAYAQTSKNNKAELRNGSPVYIGQTLSTTSGGHLYLRMLDGAFISLRPEAVVTIYQYTVDPVNPTNNQIRLDVQKGVVRSVTGKGGEANKAGFRLNTPVAAIGISGTDFTVYTSRLQSSVTIRQGGIVVSPFNDNCSRNSLGACDGGQAVKLLASNQQALAEVNAAHANLVNKANAKVVPDNIQPAHPEEDKSVKAVKETPLSQTTPAVTAEAKTTETPKEASSTTTTAADTTSTKTKTSTATTSNSNVAATTEKNVVVSGNTTSTETSTTAANTSASANTTANNTTSGTSTSGTSSSSSVAALNGSTLGAESTTSSTTITATKTETTTVATPDVASLTPVTKEVGAKGSVTSELTGKVVTQTPSVTDLQPSTTAASSNTSTSTVTPATTVPTDTNATATAKPQSFYWGRWTSYAETPEQNIRNDPSRSKQIFNGNKVYLLATTDDRKAPMNLPKDRTIQFNLDKGEAVIKTGESSSIPAEIVPGSASLSVDTGNNRFATKLDVKSSTLTNGVANLYAQGNLTPNNGNLVSNLTQSNMDVRGGLNRDGTQAGYVFEQEGTNIEGATSWLAKP